MKKSVCPIILSILFYATLCFGGELGQGDIDWDARSFINPRTGELTIFTGERTPSERKRADRIKEKARRSSTPVKKSREGEESVNVYTGEEILHIGGGEAINLRTGERIINYDGDASYNVDTGERTYKPVDEERDLYRD